MITKPDVASGPPISLSEFCFYFFFHDLHVIVLCAVWCSLSVDDSCSEGGRGSEQQFEDWCAMLYDQPRLNDAPGGFSATAVCERELQVTMCPPGWAYYRDIANTEGGRDSCLKVSAHVTWDGWNGALHGCPAGSHLLTVTSSERTIGLMGFAASIAPFPVYIGCSQSPSAFYVQREWSWVDGTPATNLNCGDTPGCGIWKSGEPK